MNEQFLYDKLAERKAANAFRQLKHESDGIDFCSNDYLGLSRQPVSGDTGGAHGSTGSRLISGNSAFAMDLERRIAEFHQAEAALLYNSGYDANLGLLSAVVRKGDTVLYDQLSHASIRDGIRLGFGQSFSFLHNDPADLEKKLSQAGRGSGEIFVVTEGVFSMDGDKAPLPEISAVCERFQARLIVDEAHALGVVGDKGEGLAQSLQLPCFARVYTYGKAAGAHGAAVVGSAYLRDYLVNFSRPFIYTTAAPPQALMAIDSAYRNFPAMQAQRQYLNELINSFQSAAIPLEKLVSDTPIQAVVIPGNEAVRSLAAHLQASGIDVRPILYPTVPRGLERLRIVLHAFNSSDELERLVKCLRDFPIS